MAEDGFFWRLQRDDFRDVHSTGNDYTCGTDIFLQVLWKETKQGSGKWSVEDIQCSWD